MARKSASLAERYRLHRAAFELALQLGCTPKEAEEQIARNAAHAQWKQGRDRLEALRNAPLRPAEPDPPPPPWWQRD